MEQLKINSYGEEYQLKIEIRKYAINDNLCIQLLYYDDEFESYMPYATLTTNLDGKLGDGCAYVDTNNCPWAIPLIEKYKLGEYCGTMKQSGFCSYPLYKFDLDALAKHSI